MSAYYNEYDKATTAWLRSLISKGLIADGEVDDRPIQDVQPGDLYEFTQCHFFAGIGGWSLTLRDVGWPDDKPVWTGSCPCQSFSTAGKQLGFADKQKHLWPEFKRLILGCRPAQIFGEQVENAVELGDETQSWLDLVSSDLDKAGYEVGAAVLSAAYVGAPHLRERLYFVADSTGIRGSQEFQPVGNGVDDDFWATADWVRYPDGKRRAHKPGVRTVADGIPGGMALLRGAGNAIVPSQAAEFIRAYLEIRE